MPKRTLCEAGGTLVRREPPLRALLGYDPADLDDDTAFAAEVLARAIPAGAERDAVRALALAQFRSCEELVREDVAVTAARDRDPGGDITTLLFGNGLHALLGYRLTNALYAEGLHASAFAAKAHFLRAFGADIMPQARIGRRVWIDHGLGLVVGQTAVIEEDVSLWHGVTLGTNLVDRGACRHPRLRRGCVIGAYAQLIGPIDIGEGAVVAAGATVTEDVPPRSIAVGAKGRVLEGRARSLDELGIPVGELS